MKNNSISGQYEQLMSELSTYEALLSQYEAECRGEDEIRTVSSIVYDIVDDINLMRELYPHEIQ
jgi:hypothetical protein